MTIISHGIPSSKYFVIAQPPTGTYGQTKGQEVVLKDPKSDAQHKAIVDDLWELSLRELPDSMCKWAYGLTKAKLLPLLIKKYPIIDTKNQVNFLLLKKLD